jgi:hypothetical protein
MYERRGQEEIDLTYVRTHAGLDNGIHLRASQRLEGSLFSGRCVIQALSVGLCLFWNTYRSITELGEASWLNNLDLNNLYLNNKEL